MEKEDNLLKKRLIELSNLAYRRGIATYSDFLNLNELHILHTLPKAELPVAYTTFGGYAFSERQIAAFIPDAFCAYREEKEIQEDYPIDVIRIRPLQEKFGEELSHRDYLGALLNLGIDRSKVGDILIEGKEAVVFVKDQISEYIIDELYKVRHTHVSVEKISMSDFQYTPNIEEIKGNVASVRLDALIAMAYKLSRGHCVPLIEGAKVYVNGKLITTNAYQIKEDDIVSVRGMGRFQFKGVISETRKGRLFVTIHKYI